MDANKTDFADAWKLLQRTQKMLSGGDMRMILEREDLKMDIDAFFARFQSTSN